MTRTRRRWTRKQTSDLPQITNQRWKSPYSSLSLYACMCANFFECVCVYGWVGRWKWTYTVKIGIQLNRTTKTRQPTGQPQQLWPWFNSSSWRSHDEGTEARLTVSVTTPRVLRSNRYEQQTGGASNCVCQPRNHCPGTAQFGPSCTNRFPPFDI